MGMRQRLGVAACFLGDPELLILDEPMNGLDPAGMHEMRAMILSLVAEGRTVVLSSHLLDEVERTCDAVAIVDRGHVIRQGSIAELLSGAASSRRSSAPTRPRRRPSSRSNLGATLRSATHGLDLDAPAGTGARDRRGQPTTRRGGVRGLPASGGPGLPRVVVLEVTSRLGGEE